MEDLLPQIRGAVGAALRISRIAGAAVTALVQRNEMRGRARQPRGHEDLLGVHGEMDQRAPLKLEDDLAGIAVEAVLALGILKRLACEGILQFRGGDGDAVDGDRDVQLACVARAVGELAGDADAVGLVARLQFGVQSVRRLEEGHAQGPPVALEAVPQRGQGAVSVHQLTQVGQDQLAGPRAVQCFQLAPLFGLRLADERQRNLREDGALTVEAGLVHRYVALGEQVQLDGGLKSGF